MKLHPIALIVAMSPAAHYLWIDIWQRGAVLIWYEIYRAAHLAANIAHPQSQLPGQHLVAVLRGPNHVVTMVKHAMPTGCVLHDHNPILRAKAPSGRRGFRPMSGY